MDLPGIEIRPIVEMTGATLFNEVFFTDVRIPHDLLVGEVEPGLGTGQGHARATNACRCRAAARCGAWDPTRPDLLDVVRARGGVADPVLRQRLAQLHIDAEVLRLIRLRTVSSAIRGEAPGPEASVRKVLADEHGQEIMALAKDLAGSGALLTDVGPLGGTDRPVELRLPVRPGADDRREAPARCSATSSPNGCSAFPTTSMWRRASPGPTVGVGLPESSVAPMRVLVTGGAGLVAGWLIRTAPPTVEMLSTGHSTPVPDEVRDRLERVDRIDLANGESVDRLVAESRPDVVVHAAYARTARDIVDATASVARARARSGVPVIHLSTDVVFGGEPRTYFEDGSAEPRQRLRTLEGRGRGDRDGGGPRRLRHEDVAGRVARSSGRGDVIAVGPGRPGSHGPHVHR